MAKGTSTNSGPAPDPNALRRDRKSDQAGWVDLPSEGRKGRTPAWPLSEASKREIELWRREWRRPQAVMWERNEQELEVALYIRSLVDAESPKATVASRTLVRQQQEALGLSLPGLHRNRWRISSNEIAARKPIRASGPSVRDRLKVVQGGGA